MTTRPPTWGTTATLTASGKRAVVLLTVFGDLLVLGLAFLDQTGNLASYAAQVAAITGAGLVALGVVTGAGSYGHASQYQGLGSPTGRVTVPPAGPIHLAARDPADRPPSDPHLWD